MQYVIFDRVREKKTTLSSKVIRFPKTLVPVTLGLIIPKLMAEKSGSKTKEDYCEKLSSRRET